MKKAELYKKLIEAEERIVALEKENKEIKSLYNKANELQKLYFDSYKLYFDSYIEIVDKFREANRELIEMKLQEMQQRKQVLDNYN